MLKSFDTARDIVNQLTTVNEVVLFGAGIFTGSADATGEANIKKFNHWVSGSGVSGSFYHASYNQNFSQSLAVELLDVTFGYSISSSFFSNSVAGIAGGGDTSNQIVEKNRIYKLFAKQLLGSEESFFTIDGDSRHELIFVAVRRSQYKDELKKGTIAFLMMNSGSGQGGAGNVEFDDQIFNDDGAVSTFTRTERGDTAELTSGSLVGGLVFYQAGMLVLIPDRVSNTGSADVGAGDEGNFWSGSFDYNSLVFSGGGSDSASDPGRVDNLIDAVRYRFKNLSTVNQSNLHSTFYFCRALNDEFNYSSNPTFIDTGGRIIPTSGTTDLSTRTYITKVGLLGENNDVLAVAALSKPLKKTPDSELLVKVRLDY